MKKLDVALGGEEKLFEDVLLMLDCGGWFGDDGEVVFDRPVQKECEILKVVRIQGGKGGSGC